MNNPFQNPTIYIGNLRIDEPVTAFTDFLFAAVCLFAFLNTREKSALTGPNLYRWFFLGIGISSFISALMGHAFLYRFGFGAKIYGWEANVIGAAISQFAAIYHTRPTIGEPAFKKLLIFNYIEVIAAVALTAIIFTFNVVEIHSAYSLLAMVTVLEILHYKKTKSVLSKYMLIGVGICILAVLVHLFKLAISVWFNHLDLSHIFMCIAMYMMYRGVKLNKEPA